MKKVLKLTLTLLVVCIMMIGSVYALTSEINIKSSKAIIEEGEEFTVELYTSKLQSDTGVISLGATLEYDKEKLTLVKMEGENDWETPTEGKTYNPSTGKIAIERKSLGKNDESILRITFKAKEKIEGEANISLKDVMLADGLTTPVKVSLMKSDITIKQKTIDITPENPDDTKIPENPTPDDSSNKPTNKPTTKPTDTTKKPDTTVKNEQLPQTGDNSNHILLIVLIALMILAVAIFCIRTMKVNKKIRRI